ncbi:ATP-dependent Clp protease proteolytic subunit [bacterium]|nr:ATP-dependent Clp protease proteolytic subunit [bacterium]
MNLSYVIEGENEKEKSYEIFSRLLKDRIIYIQGQFNDDMANNVVAQLLYLNSRDKEKDIYMYINSPGGSISSMYSIFDVMNYIDADVHTVGIGSVCSAGSFILAAGTKGKRSCLPNTEIMIHELSTGTKGKATHIFSMADVYKKLYEKMAKQYVGFTGQSLTKIKKDMQKDYFMDSEEALAYGLIDKIIEGK